MEKDKNTANEILDRVNLKLTMFSEIFAHYPPQEGLSEDAIQGINVFLNDLNREIGSIINERN